MLTRHLQLNYLLSHLYTWIKYIVSYYHILVAILLSIINIFCGWNRTFEQELMLTAILMVVLWKDRIARGCFFVMLGARTTPEGEFPLLSVEGCKHTPFLTPILYNPSGTNTITIGDFIRDEQWKPFHF